MKKLILFLVLTACSFKPMFSSNDTDVFVAPIRGINGIELRNSLNTQFGGVHDQNAKYTLEVNLSDPSTQYKALELSGVATWQEVKLNASYVLKQGDKVIVSGSESASESYTFVNYLVASNAAYNNAVMDAINVLSDKISMRVIVETKKEEK